LDKVAEAIMTGLPAAYAWLEDVADKPRMLSEALELYGVTEAQGAADNPVIVAWAHEIGGSVEHAYLHDAVAWCGLFMAVVAQRAAKTPPVNPLWALNWMRFGQSAGPPALGDTLVFRRPGGGHVGLYVGEDDGTDARAPAYHVLGGNESDKVTIVPMSRARLVTARRPIWKVAQPRGVVPHQLEPSGELSTDER
jgi:uncharacterized protein (TIGR02594 family)